MLTCYYFTLTNHWQFWLTWLTLSFLTFFPRGVSSVSVKLVNGVSQGCQSSCYIPVVIEELHCVINRCQPFWLCRLTMSQTRDSANQLMRKPLQRMHFVRRHRRHRRHRRRHYYYIPTSCQPMKILQLCSEVQLPLLLCTFVFSFY